MQCDNTHTRTHMNTYSVEVVHKICLWAYGETSKHTKNEIYTTKNKNVFQRWKQRERMPRDTRCVPQKRAVKFSGAMYLSVCVCVCELFACMCDPLSVCPMYPVLYALRLVGKILRPYFDFIKAFVHITGQDTFCDNKILHEKPKTDDIKNGATQHTHTHTFIQSHTYSNTSKANRPS